MMRYDQDINTEEQNGVNFHGSKKNGNGIKMLIFLVLGLVILVSIIKLGVSYLWLRSNYEENLDNSMTRVYVANQVIQPGTQITADLVGTEVYMDKDLPDDYYLMIEDIVGQCTDYDVVIDRGSLFYKDMLIDCDELSEDIFDDNE